MELKDSVERRKRYHADWKHDYINKRIEQGLCRQCGKIKVTSGRYCEKCKVKLAAYAKKWAKSYLGGQIF